MPDAWVPPDWLEKTILLIGGGILTLAGKHGWTVLQTYFQKSKIDAEASHITRSDDMSLFEMERQVAKDYIALFREQTHQLKEAGDQISQIREELRVAKDELAAVTRTLNASRLLAKQMFNMLRNADVQGWQEFEKEFE